MIGCCSRLGHAEHLTQYTLKMTYFLKIVLITNLFPVEEQIVMLMTDYFAVKQ